MRSTNTSIRAYGDAAEVAWPHARADGRLVPLPLADSDNWGAAAGINSNLEDLSRWVQIAAEPWRMGRQTDLQRGTTSRDVDPVTLMPVRPGEGELAQVSPQWSAYALGWNVSDYRGQRIIHHSGGLAGMVTRTVLVPVLNLGVVVLTNQEAGAALNAIIYTVLDHYMNAAPVDWVAVLDASQKKREKEAADRVAAALAKRNPVSRPSLPLKSYAGRYRDAWYGDVLVEEQGGRLRIRFSHTPWLEGTLEHFHYDTFIARWDRRWLLADAWVTFALKADGSVEEVRMSAVSPLTDFSFDFHDLRLRPAPADAKPY